MAEFIGIMSFGDGMVDPNTTIYIDPSQIVAFEEQNRTTQVSVTVYTVGGHVFHLRPEHFWQIREKLVPGTAKEST